MVQLFEKRQHIRYKTNYEARDNTDEISALPLAVMQSCLSFTLYWGVFFFCLHVLQEKNACVRRIIYIGSMCEKKLWPYIRIPLSSQSHRRN